MEKAHIHDLAERIAQLISKETKPTEVAMLQKSIDALNARLDKIESLVSVPAPASPKPTHASQERFNILEAIADSVFGNDQKEKACTFEPNDKPCDHCSMCSSRGF